MAQKKKNGGGSPKDDSPLTRMASMAPPRPARVAPLRGDAPRGPAPVAEKRAPRPTPEHKPAPAPQGPLKAPLTYAADLLDGPTWEAETHSFAHFFGAELSQLPLHDPVPGYCRTLGPTPRTCNLCCASSYQYGAEAAAKERALGLWSAQEKSLPAPVWVASAPGRNYRSVSKRRWLSREKKLIMTEEVRYGQVRGVTVSACQQEPPEHAAIYTQLQRLLPNSRFGEELNYAIIKGSPGSPGKYHLLLNMTDFHKRRAEVNRLSKKLTQTHPSLVGIWVVQGRAEDEYYLNPPPGAWERIHGPKTMIAETGLHFSPLCFTQINPGMVPSLLSTVADWLDDPAVPLLDLYCGYGLFALSLKRTGPVVGLELSREAVSWAKQNAAHRKSKAFFSFCDLDNLELAAFARRLPAGPMVAVVDPPRGGASESLIGQLAEIGPQRVVHLVCDVEKTFAQAALWQQHGYAVRRMVGLDMFPGTPCLEVALCLEPIQSSLSAPT